MFKKSIKTFDIDARSSIEEPSWRPYRSQNKYIL